MAKKDFDVTSDRLGTRDPLPVTEIGDPGPIERVSENDFVAAAGLEAFMNEILTVVVHEDSNENAVEMPCPNVNGVNQPFIRGKAQQVRRKYVEALARSRIIRYEQKTVDANRPENISMVEKSAVTYPFSVVHDPNPRGAAWLSAILAQP